MKRKKLIINSLFDYKDRSINSSIESETDENDKIKEQKNEKLKQQKFNLIDENYEVSEDGSLTDDDPLNI